MKQKSFFKKYIEKAAVNVAVKVTKPVTKPWLRFKGIMQKYPRASIAVMLGVVIINAGIMVGFAGDFKSVSYSFNNSNTPRPIGEGWEADMGIPFNFENYRTMKAIQDTLSWLAAKEKRTTADTAVLLRLIDKIEKLDPLFFEKIKKISYGKDTITGKGKK